MLSPTTKLSLSKQTLIRLIVDHSRLHESIGDVGHRIRSTAGGWRPVWLGRYPHPVEGYAELEAGWRSVPLAAHPGPQVYEAAGGLSARSACPNRSGRGRSEELAGGAAAVGRPLH